MIICIAEDRASETTAVKLLLLSLTQHCPDIPIVLTFPPASPSFMRWLESLPQVTLRTKAVVMNQGWNIKPYLLLSLLNEGYDDICWLDSDILVANDFRPLLQKLSPETVMICEEALYGGHADHGQRTSAWQLPVGREIPFTLNTGVLRITRQHQGLLQRWCNLLGSPEYLQAQRQFWYERPAHLVGDQDVLTALLGSSEFSNVPLHILRRGAGVIQYFGFSAYTLQERWQTLRHGLPLFIHCQGWKPWHIKQGHTGDQLKQRLQKSYIELSPYMQLARDLRYQLDEQPDWLVSISWTSRISHLVGFYHPALVGLPLAIVFDAVRWLKNMGWWAKPASEVH